MIESKSRGVLDTRLRGYDIWCVRAPWHLRTNQRVRDESTSSHPSHSTQDSIPI